MYRPNLVVTEILNESYSNSDFTGLLAGYKPSARYSAGIWGRFFFIQTTGENFSIARAEKKLWAEFEIAHGNSRLCMALTLRSGFQMLTKAKRIIGIQLEWR